MFGKIPASNPVMTSLAPIVNVKGTPTKLEPHKFRILDEVVDANVSKTPAGHKDRPASCFGEQLHMDFNFTRASSVNYNKDKNMKHLIATGPGTATLLGDPRAPDPE